MIFGTPEKTKEMFADPHIPFVRVEEAEVSAKYRWVLGVDGIDYLASGYDYATPEEAKKDGQRLIDLVRSDGYMKWAEITQNFFAALREG